MSAGFFKIPPAELGENCLDCCWCVVTVRPLSSDASNIDLVFGWKFSAKISCLLGWLVIGDSAGSGFTVPAMSSDDVAFFSELINYTFRFWLTSRILSLSCLSCATYESSS